MLGSLAMFCPQHIQHMLAWPVARLDKTSNSSVMLDRTLQLSLHLADNPPRGWKVYKRCGDQCCSMRVAACLKHHSSRSQAAMSWHRRLPAPSLHSCSLPPTFTCPATSSMSFTSAASIRSSLPLSSTTLPGARSSGHLQHQATASTLQAHAVYNTT